eukprot:CAMPEP_0182864532 /NCGR_PEP_ID=MMETSP0034_2-20130328/7219_1 /TAXON_ID=156128 /ORGANISM="Nephroselmis pyriformis, Strain CCMP717" /LENGTH=152 /DNA_ID=CAMNT_0024996791 /DNA_START=177 /DNA_END=632 /DNA_ORIENTATION=-
MPAIPSLSTERAAELLVLLLEGARYDDMEDLEAAIAEGVDLNGKDSNDRTALHMACANGHADIVKRLVDAGADLSVSNAEKNTPLHWACLNGKVEVVKVLMDASASPSALNSADRTPVDEALDRGHQACVDIINASDVVAAMEQQALGGAAG